MSERQTFRRHERIRKREEFARIFNARCSASDDVLVVYAAANDRACSRLGLSVSRRVGNAVTRAYVRRRIREAFRRSKAELPVGYDLICVARRAAADRGHDVAASLSEVTGRAVARWLERFPPERTPRSAPDR